MIFLFSIFAISAGLSHFPLSSKEEIKYVSKEESPLLALNKIDDFIGIIGREKISSSPEKQVDIYYLKNLKALKSVRLKEVPVVNGLQKRDCNQSLICTIRQNLLVDIDSMPSKQLDRKALWLFACRALW